MQIHSLILLQNLQLSAILAVMCLNEKFEV